MPSRGQGRWILRLCRHGEVESSWRGGKMSWKISNPRSRTDFFGTAWDMADDRKQKMMDDLPPQLGHSWKGTLRCWSRTHHHCQSSSTMAPVSWTEARVSGFPVSVEKIGSGRQRKRHPCGTDCPGLCRRRPGGNSPSSSGRGICSPGNEPHCTVSLKYKGKRFILFHYQNFS